MTGSIAPAGSRADRRRALPIAGAALLALGWAAPPMVPASRADTPPSQASGVAIPDGQIDAAIRRLDGLALDLMQRSRIPGMAVAVVRDGRTVYARGFGVRKAGESLPVDADTVFQIASLSKSLAATVVAHEVGAGRVSWTTPVKETLPWFALSDAWVSDRVTVGDLFSHRSGLPDHAGDDLEDVGFDRRTVLDRLRLLPLHGFRDTYAYTNFGLTAAAEAVAAASGRDWAQLCRDVLYDPLGMTRTSSRFADYEGEANRAWGHVRAGDGYQPKYRRMPDAQSPAGGVSSTVRDLARWMALVLGNGRFEGRQVVAADALLPALTAQTVSAPSHDVESRPGFYGFGVNVGVSPSGRVVLSHSGAFSLGAGTRYALLPSARIGIVVLTNAAPGGVAEALGESFLDLVQFGAVGRDWFALYGPVLEALNAPTGDLVGKTPPADPAPAAQLSAYEGVYANAYFGDAAITVVDQALHLRLGPDGRYVLRHWTGDTFAVSPVSENQPEGSRSSVTFSRGGPGPATMTIGSLSGNGQGRFLRR